MKGGMKGLEVSGRGGAGRESRGDSMESSRVAAPGCAELREGVDLMRT